MPKFGYETEGLEIVRSFPEQVKGRIFLITGPSPGGIGAETALSLAAGSPAALLLLGRSRTKCQPVIDSIRAKDPSILVKFVEVDLASLASVRAAADAILADPEIPRIDVVINNAGVMWCPLSRTPEGFELQLASCHLGHFVLTNRLMPKVLAAGPVARIVNVSSSGNKMGPVRWDDPNFLREGSYTPLAGYGQAKTANILFTVALNARLARGGGGRGARAYALHPGSIPSGLQKFSTPELVAEAVRMVVPGGKMPSRWKTLQQGCSTTLRAALDPALEGEEGVFLEDCNLFTDPATLDPRALDPVDAERLWKMSEDLVGEKFEY
ncbi:NAD(P)-binding protein [Pleurostoma richardsiae]|uniref:NAD(P)-binding protein n=1 Tax=Pleurostoma richardsiae TaxID=41990 RepID=A0AA38S8L2_9PEZI|nr:NAD(P)-binding protein [Pleurostoma richardsiae]